MADHMEGISRALILKSIMHYLAFLKGHRPCLHVQLVSNNAFGRTNTCATDVRKLNTTDPNSVNFVLALEPVILKVNANNKTKYSIAINSMHSK